MEQRKQRFVTFEQAVATRAVAAAATDGSTVQRSLPRLWRLPLCNKHKGMYWRLVLNGLPLALSTHSNVLTD